MLRAHAHGGLADLSLVPPQRLGRLLYEHRVARFLTLEELAARSHRLSASELHAVEQGAVTLTDAELSGLAALYGFELTQLIPARASLVIDRDEGLLAAGRHLTRLRKRATADQVLGRYLALVYALRGQTRGGRIGLRRLDLETLAEALSLTPDAVEAALVELMDEPDRLAAVEVDGRAALPQIGVLVALTDAGTLVLQPTGARRVSPAVDDPAVLFGE